MKKGGVSKYKLSRIAIESMKNSLRLHFDSILLIENGSYPTAFQLSVLALEEFAKASWIEHYVWSSETNDGYPEEDFEQKWLQLLYKHPEKQQAFISRDVFSYSPKFAEFVSLRRLEEKKQRATYVGLDKSGSKINIKSRVSTPKRIKKVDASQMISLINSEFKEVCVRIKNEGGKYFYIEAMNTIFSRSVYRRLMKWPHQTGIKSKKWASSALQRLFKKAR